MPYTCPSCHLTSFHPTDEAQRYCGRCHAYGQPALGGRAVLTSRSGLHSLSGPDTAEWRAQARAMLDALDSSPDRAADMV